ncbi:ATP-binding protein [Aureibacter tunicatorum]|uniref:ATP-dependent 26S proteasome regulatory subunit n=1 Tax=Aureibacter tunicatorum TaxID=866807 RepID=A0AAE4BV84_9BACT|nr:ATP-binding protein [Aureibacter tunicatorum]MDR6241825.1 ATP-dependent 26S proteasome regulatory subunit [Aureibacter tunicatorum]
MEKLLVDSRSGSEKTETGKFAPTLRTLIFLMCGNEEQNIVEQFINLTNSNNPLWLHDILELKESKYGRQNDSFYLSNDFLRYLYGGEKPKLDTGVNFPAKYSSTKLDFEDVVLTESTKKELKDVFKFLEVHKKIKSSPSLKKVIRESYVVIFDGEPGTGKSITAKTIGKKYGMPTYSVNLSKMVSKYIGETEKNLEKVFDRFSGKECILFFDEADSIFGKRTEVKDSKDRFANQETAYLLQRIEDFEGLIILATNIRDMRQTLDKAFLRRIRRKITFKFPDYQERLQLWDNSLPEGFSFEEGLKEKLAKNFQLTGANISNIVSDAIIDALYVDNVVIGFDIIEPLLKLEFQKRDIPYGPCTDDQAQRSPERRYGKAVLTGRNF